MARQETELNLDLDTAGKGSGKGKLLILIGGVLVLLLVAGVAAYFLLFSGDKAEPAAEAAPPPVVTQIAYTEIDPTFVVNIQGNKRARLFQVTVVVETKTADAEAAIKKHMPLISNGLLQLFSGADPDALRTTEGRNELREQSLLKIQEIMTQQVGAPTAERVLFTSFVMQ